MTPAVLPQLVANDGTRALRAFDVPVLAGVDLRAMRWQERRERLELLAQAYHPRGRTGTSLRGG